jgi:nucleoside-diphosphate-sugar epimerase
MNSAREQQSFLDRSVLVTGGGGFIGANLVRRLNDLGARVHLLMRPQAGSWRIREIMEHTQIHTGDITDGDSLARAFAESAPEFVFHLATPRGNDASAWVRMAEVNVLGALRLVEQLQKTPSTHMVVAGSGLEYGPNAQPHREQDTLTPNTWHGVGKVAAGLIFLQAASSFGLRINHLRLFHVYGPWESPHRLLPSVIRASLCGTPLPLTRSDVRRDWIYVEDVVDALLSAASAETQGETCNIGSGTETSNERVVDIVEQLTGITLVRVPGVFPCSVSDTAHRCADISKSKMLLGWMPRHDITAGISAMLGWYRLNPHVWESETGGKPLHV